MSALETLSLLSLSRGDAAVLRVVWLDSLRFSEASSQAEVADTARVSPRTLRHLAHQAAAARVLAETESLPKAA